MATVKRANVAPTHPTVWVGLALAVVGLLFAVYAYTGARVYDVRFAIVAIVGALLALAGIFVAAWGRSLMAARASRARRAGISADALAMARPPSDEAPAPSSEDAPTVAAPPRERTRFAFSLPKRGRKEPAEEERRERAVPAGVFAFRRREPQPASEPVPEQTAAPRLDDGAPLVTLAPSPAQAQAPAEAVRVTLRCPQCASTFQATGVRPFEAICGSCGFSATV